MKKTLHILAFAVALMLSQVASGQDGRYSQFFNNPVYLNPAMAGNGIQYIRVTGIYRTQWAGLGTPFTTQGLSVDKSVNRFGIGGFINREGAGDNGIRTLNIVGNLAYHFSFGEDKLNTISAGLQVGLINKSFDPNKMTFDNQYDPDAGYDPNMSSGEVFTTTSVSRPDVNAGFSYQRGWGRDDIRFRPFVSISFAHLNKPNETFIIDGNKAPVKSTLYTGAAFQVNKEVVVTPSMLYMQQEHFRETNFGATCSYKLNNSNSIQFGIFNRMDDALIVYTGYQLNQVILGMSYDANTSSLSESGKGFNAFEISLSWSPLPRKKAEPEFDPELEPVTEMQLPLLGSGLIPTRQPEMVLTEIPAVAPAVVVVPDAVAETVRETPKAEAEPKSAPAPVKETPKVDKTIEAAPAVVATVHPKTEKTITDSDKDGIEDAKDGCPYIKGTAATGGCPDSDSDGIQDLEDKCPMEAGVAATGGCPEAGSNISASQVLVKKYNNVLFEPGSKALNTPDIFDIIERAIEQMYRDKTTRAVLSGHTDNEGDASVNMELSQSRADAVKKYMVKMGIDPSRITTVPYGENMPLENNSGTEGRRLNRRVEINIVK